MKIHNVLYLLRDDLENLPPSISQILTLCEIGCNVTVVTMHASQYIRDFLNDREVSFLSLSEACADGTDILRRFRRLFAYRALARRAIAAESYDLLWIGSGDTARYCKDLFAKNTAPSVLNIYELYDKNPEILRAIKPVAQNAACVVVPEYNRAHILKVWLELKKTPVIIPNKPCFPVVEILPDTKKIVDELKTLRKKIVLYQGWIGKDRNVSQIARALDLLEQKDEYALVLMGNAPSPDTVEKIRSIFSGTIHIPFLNPPQHLFVTELAHMGVATYDDSTLNNIFCAPNKIYEYAEKNVPVLARDIPGLSSTVGKYRAGVCVDMDDPDEIAAAILKISADHETYAAALGGFLDACGVEQSIRKIIRTCEEMIR